MTEEYWVAVLEQEDRLISNSDRKFRYHCYSLESMSEELVFHVIFRSLEYDFLDSVHNEHLSAALARLTDRQRRVIELHFWQGYQYKEIAVILGCDPSAVTRLLQRAFKQIRIYFLSR